jgi:hypothetical protein
MVDPLHEYGSLHGIEHCEKPEIPDPELLLIGRNESLKESIRLAGRSLKFRHDPARDWGIQPREVPRSGFRPAEGPRLQRFSRRFSCA